MKLVKCVIPHSFYNCQVYCKMGEKVDEKSSVLLGFKDYLPVITNSETNSKRINERPNKKIVKVQVDPSTGEKFINLNGKKLKMVPESQIKSQLQLTNQKSLCMKPAKRFRVLTKIPFNPNSIHGVQANLESQVNLIKLQGNDNSCQCSKLKETNFISEKNPIIYKDKHLFGNNLIEEITTDNKEKFNKLMDSANSASLKCDTQKIAPKTTDMKICSNEKDVHVLEPNKDNKLKISEELKDAEIQTDESLFRNHENNFDEFIDYLNSTDDFPSSFCSVDPSFVSPPEPNTSNTLAQKFFEALRRALLPDHEGNMPIHVGVITKNFELVKRSIFLLKILQQGVDLRNNNDLTPLQLAVMYDSDKNIIECLLINNARIDIVDAEGNNIIHLAVQNERTDLLSTLLKYIRKPCPLLNQYNHEGLTPLLICSMKGFYNCTKLLLNMESDVNLRDQISGRTALFHAAERKDMAMVQLLLTRNADTKIKNFFGTSAHDAMYEIDEIPPGIKSLILGRTLKRKNAEDTRGMAKPKKQDDAKKFCLKTYARLEKVPDMIKSYKKL